MTIAARSILFVPGDRAERFEKARASGADMVVIDLEDAVLPDRKIAARDAVHDALASLDEPRFVVRVNSLDTDWHADDVRALAALPGVAGLMLPKAEGAGSVAALAARAGLPILPVATETPAAIFQLGSYASVAPHLAGLTWGAEDLPAAIGASTAREADGGYTAPYQLARTLTLFGAHAAGVAAIETVFPDFRDLDALAAYAARGRRDGFTGMMAIHPAQVPVINAAFTPSDAERAAAQAIVDLFAANPGAGALQLDGRMVDAPHLKQARRILGLA